MERCYHRSKLLLVDQNYIGVFFSKLPLNQDFYSENQSSSTCEKSGTVWRSHLPERNASVIEKKNQFNKHLTEEQSVVGLIIKLRMTKIELETTPGLL